jgi:hypothetical protein
MSPHTRTKNEIIINPSKNTTWDLLFHQLKVNEKFWLLHDKDICKITLSSPCLWVSFHPQTPLSTSN